MPLSAAEYIEQRLDPEIEYYELRSAKNKRYFHLASLVAILASGLVPVLAAADVDRVVLAASGGIASVVLASLALFKWQENWLQFRGNAEGLKKERALYDTRTGPYRDLDGDELTEMLTLRVEELISREHQVWQLTQRMRHSSTNS